MWFAKRSKPYISLGRYVAGVVIATVLLYHFPLWRYVLHHTDPIASRFFILLSIGVSLIAVNTFLFTIFAVILGKYFRYFAALQFLINAVAYYFIVNYNVILDRAMMGNVFNTDMQESTSYLSLSLIRYIVVWGVLPALVALYFRIDSVKRIKVLLSGSATLFIGVSILYLNASTWLWMDKHAKYIGGLSLPWSYLINAVRYKQKQALKHKHYLKLPQAVLKDDNPMLVVLVIGESARAQNFSLYGYQRKTNPALTRHPNLRILPNAYAAATYTTASVHAMLSYKGDTSDDYEPLPNYLQRSGVDVIWRSRNWGEPKLQVALLERDDNLSRQCKEDQGANYDEALLCGLKRIVTERSAPKQLIVLHTAGSHGPAYYRKYPPRFARFKPECKSVDIRKCTPQSLLNSYDNTIVYTDYFLSKVIETLKSLKIPSVMIYLSDHGESLGESNFYLHGTPYAIAPDYQKKIPFLIWESPAYLKEQNLSKPYIKILPRYGDQHIFHTVIGALGLKTPVYDPARDLLRRE